MISHCLMGGMTTTMGRDTGTMDVTYPPKRLVCHFIDPKAKPFLETLVAVTRWVLACPKANGVLSRIFFPAGHTCQSLVIALLADLFIGVLGDFLVDLFLVDLFLGMCVNL